MVSSGDKGLHGTLWGVLLVFEIFCSSITDTSFTSVEMWSIRGEMLGNFVEVVAEVVTQLVASPADVESLETGFVVLPLFVIVCFAIVVTSFVSV